MPCWCQSSDSLLTWFVLVILQRTLNLFHFPMFYLNLSEIMEHGKRPPISWLSLLSNLQAQTELHSVMWPFALPVLSKLWPHPPRVVSDEEISAMISAGLAMVWKHRYSIKKKKGNRETHDELVLFKIFFYFSPHANTFVTNIIFPDDICTVSL